MPCTFLSQMETDYVLDIYFSDPSPSTRDDKTKPYSDPSPSYADEYEMERKKREKGVKLGFENGEAVKLSEKLYRGDKYDWVESQLSTSLSLSLSLSLSFCMCMRVFSNIFQT